MFLNSGGDEGQVEVLFLIRIHNVIIKLDSELLEDLRQGTTGLVMEKHQKSFVCFSIPQSFSFTHGKLSA